MKTTYRTVGLSLGACMAALSACAAPVDEIEDDEVAVLGEAASFLTTAEPVKDRYIVVLKNDAPALGFAPIPAVAAEMAKAHGGRVHHRRIRAAPGSSVGLEERYRDDPGPHLAELPPLPRRTVTGKGVDYAQRAGTVPWRSSPTRGPPACESALEALGPSVTADATVACAAAALARGGSITGGSRPGPSARCLTLPMSRGARSQARSAARRRNSAGGSSSPRHDDGASSVPRRRSRHRQRTSSCRSAPGSSGRALRDEHSRARRDALSRRRSRSPAAAAAPQRSPTRSTAERSHPGSGHRSRGRGHRDGARRAGQARRRQRTAGACAHAPDRALLMLGHADEAAADLEVASRIADELRQPGHFWFVCADPSACSRSPKAGSATPRRSSIRRARTAPARNRTWRLRSMRSSGTRSVTSAAPWRTSSRRSASRSGASRPPDVPLRAGAAARTPRTALGGPADAPRSGRRRLLRAAVRSGMAYSMSLLSETAALLNDVDAPPRSTACCSPGRH